MREIRLRRGVAAPCGPDAGVVLPWYRTGAPQISHSTGMSCAASPVRAHLGGAPPPQRERVKYLRMSKPNVLPAKYSSMVWRSLPRVT